MNYKISELNTLTDPVSSDLLVGLDLNSDSTGLSETKKITIGTLSQFVFDNQVSASLNEIELDVSKLQSSSSVASASIQQLSSSFLATSHSLSVGKLNSSITSSVLVVSTSFATVTSYGIPFLNVSGKIYDTFLPTNYNYVTSVFGRLGDITASKGDYSASQITFPVPLLGTSDNVYSYLLELSGSKMNRSGNEIFNGNLNIQGNLTASNIGAAIISGGVFIGNGSQLTGISATDAIVANPAGGQKQTLNGDLSITGSLSLTSEINATSAGIRFGANIQTVAYLGDNGSGSIINVFPKGNNGGWNKVYDSILVSDGYNRIWSRGYGIGFNGSPNRSDIYGFKNLQLPQGDNTSVQSIYVIGKTSNVIQTNQGIYAFGNNIYGQNGTNSAISANVTAPVSMSFITGSSNSTRVGGVVIASASIKNKYVNNGNDYYDSPNMGILDTNHRLFISGKNINGVFGQGYTKDAIYSSSMKITGSYKDFVLESSPIGAATFVAVTDDPTPGLVSCGYNYYGQLGTGLTKTETGSIQTISGLGITAGDIIKLDSMRGDWGGAYGFLALKYPSNLGSGSLYGWGYNVSGILGTNRTSPYQLTFTSQSVNMGDKIMDIFSIGSQNGTSLIIKTSYADKFQYFGIGFNNYGQLGVGDTSNKTTFTEIKSLYDVNVVKFAGSPTYAGVNYPISIYALDSTGIVWSTGYNGSGQLGIGGLVDSNTFQKIRFNTVVNDIYTTTDGVYLYGSDKSIYYAGHLVYGDRTAYLTDQFTKVF